MIRRLWVGLQRAFSIRRIIKFALRCALVALVVALVPIVYIEVGCRGGGARRDYRPIITDPVYRRPQANTYLAYPESHIRHAYDGLARTLNTADEHSFDYLRSVGGFWGSTCTLMRAAAEHGEVARDTRNTVHMIGVGFTFEMLARAAYENTVGRFTAWLRGPVKAPQDRVVATVAADYAAFLRQAPWYSYPFHGKARELWAAPVEQKIRGWERRLGIGFEFEAKAVFGKIRGRAASPAPPVVRSVVSGVAVPALARMADVKIVGKHEGGVEIETPRDDRFTRILVEIARQAGTIREIAGNDAIVVSMTVPDGTGVRVQHGTVLLAMKRDGLPGERLLVTVDVSELAAFLTTYPPGDPGLEHVFD